MNEWISGWMAGCEWVKHKALKKANERWRSRESRWKKWNAFSTYAWFSFWYEWMLKWRRKTVNQSWKNTLSHLIYTMFNIFMIITGNNTHSSSRSFTNDVSVWSQEQKMKNTNNQRKREWRKINKKIWGNFKEPNENQHFKSFIIHFNINLI